jgi:hypothetical protein
MLCGAGALSEGLFITFDDHDRAASMVHDPGCTGSQQGLTQALSVGGDDNQVRVDLPRLLKDALGRVAFGNNGVGSDVLGQVGVNVLLQLPGYSFHGIFHRRVGEEGGYHGHAEARNNGKYMDLRIMLSSFIDCDFYRFGSKLGLLQVDRHQYLLEHVVFLLITRIDEVDANLVIRPVEPLQQRPCVYAG